MNNIFGKLQICFNLYLDIIFIYLLVIFGLMIFNIHINLFVWIAMYFITVFIINLNKKH